MRGQSVQRTRKRFELVVGALRSDRCKGGVGGGVRECDMRSMCRTPIPRPAHTFVTAASFVVAAELRLPRSWSHPSGDFPSLRVSHVALRALRFVWAFASRRGAEEVGGGRALWSRLSHVMHREFGCGCARTHTRGATQPTNIVTFKLRASAPWTRHTFNLLSPTNSRPQPERGPHDLNLHYTHTHSPNSRTLLIAATARHRAARLCSRAKSPPASEVRTCPPPRAAGRVAHPRPGAAAGARSSLSPPRAPRRRTKPTRRPPREGDGSFRAHPRPSRRPRADRTGPTTPDRRGQRGLGVAPRARATRMWALQSASPQAAHPPRGVRRAPARSGAMGEPPTRRRRRSSAQ